MLRLVVQSPGTLQESDLKDDHRGHDPGQENDDEIILERDHHVMTKIEDIVHQVDIAQVQGNDGETDHVTEDVVDQETDHVKEDEVDQRKESIDITVDHLDANNIFLIE